MMLADMIFGLICLVICMGPLVAEMWREPSLWDGVWNKIAMSVAIFGLIVAGATVIIAWLYG